MATRQSAAIVVGAGNAIGSALVERFADEDRFDTIACVDTDEGVNDVASCFEECVAHVVDVSDSDTIDEVVTETETAAPIDVAVNTMVVTDYFWVGDLDPDEWDRVIDQNLKSQYLLARAVAPRMVERERGFLVNTSSIAGQRGSVSGGVHYSAAKAGTLGLTRGLAKQLGPHVNVNCVVHGAIDIPLVTDPEASGDLWNETAVERYNELLPAGRLGKPDEIARVIEVMCGETASYMTGAVVPVEGGFSAVPTKEFLNVDR
jgi:3-oxoacyl-[acyl-carrier protein] reductase